MTKRPNRYDTASTFVPAAPAGAQWREAPRATSPEEVQAPIMPGPSVGASHAAVIKAETATSKSSVMIHASGKEQASVMLIKSAAVVAAMAVTLGGIALIAWRWADAPGWLVTCLWIVATGGGAMLVIDRIDQREHDFSPTGTDQHRTQVIAESAERVETARIVEENETKRLAIKEHYSYLDRADQRRMGQIEQKGGDVRGYIE